MNKLSESTIDYFYQYRQKAKTIKDLKNHIREIQQQHQEQVNLLYNQVQSLEIDITSMRRIITTVLENDVDSVEARLTHDPNVLDSNLWQERHTPGGYMDMDKTSSTMSSLPNSIMYGNPGADHIAVSLSHKMSAMGTPPPGGMYQHGTTVGKITP